MIRATQVHLLLWICAATFVHVTRAEVFYGNQSDMTDDARSIVSCPSEYVAQTCRCDPPHICDGSYFDGDVCVAVNSEGSTFWKQRIRANVTCAAATETNEKYLHLQKSGRNLRLSCPAGSKVVNCALRDPWAKVPAREAYLDGRFCVTPFSMCLYHQGCSLQVRCQVGNCGDPGDGVNAVKSGSLYVNDTIRYSCKPGHASHTGEVQKVVTCLPNLTWDSVPLDCEVTADRGERGQSNKQSELKRIYRNRVRNHHCSQLCSKQISPACSKTKLQKDLCILFDSTKSTQPHREEACRAHDDT